MVDSQLVTMGLGLLTIATAHAAGSGKSLPQVMAEVKQTIPGICLLGLFDTLKYLALGGRIGKTKALIGSVLNVKAATNDERWRTRAGWPGSQSG